MPRTPVTDPELLRRLGAFPASVRQRIADQRLEGDELPIAATANPGRGLGIAPGAWEAMNEATLREQVKPPGLGEPMSRMQAMRARNLERMFPVVGAEAAGLNPAEVEQLQKAARTQYMLGIMSDMADTLGGRGRGLGQAYSQAQEGLGGHVALLGQLRARNEQRGLAQEEREYRRGRDDITDAKWLAEQQRLSAGRDKPMSWEEYQLSLRDPTFASYLKERRGKGLSVSLPDGTVIEMGGEGGKVGPGELSKPTINNLQETIVKSTDRLDRLNATLSKYNPDFLRASGIVNAHTTKVKDFLGLDVSPEQRAYLDEYSQFTSSAATDLAQFLKDMSGAAVTPQEYARTEKALPSGKELSPTEFEAKSKVAVKTITRAIMRANWALKNGIGVKSVEDLSKVMPLEGIDSVYEQRANQIWQQLGGTPESKAEAIRRANQEFGLGR